jgi:fucose permease
VGFPYIARVWSDKGYSRETALQLITLMYSLGIVTAPLVIDLLLVALPSDVDDQTCQAALGISALKKSYNLSTSILAPFEDNSDYNIVQAMTPRQVTQQAPITTLYNSTSSNTEVYSLARWSFAVGSGGVTIAAVMLAVVCLAFQQTPTSSSVDASQMSNNKDVPKTATSIDLVCAMFATIFFWASVSGSLNLYLQTYAIVGLGWHKSDASHLTAVCAAGQLICRVAIMLSTYASRRPATCIFIMLVTCVCGQLLMMVADLYTAVEAVTVRVGVFITGNYLFLKKIPSIDDIKRTYSVLQNARNQSLQ